MNWRFIREVGLPKWAWRSARRQWDKRVRRRDSRMVLPTGTPIILSRLSSSASEVYVTAADIDWGAEALFARFAEADGDFFDVGAHIGYYSLYLSPLVRRVRAFEPDPRNVPVLAANLALVGNVEHVGKAVSSRSGVVRLATDGATATSHVATRGMAVDAVSLDDFVRDHDVRPALIKIDVEGHDLAVLDGARAVLTRFQPLVLTEFTQGTGDNDTGRLLALVEEADYAAFAPIWQKSASRLARPRRRLVPLDATLLGERRVKMIFLVPPRLHDAFQELVQSGERL